MERATKVYKKINISSRRLLARISGFQSEGERSILSGSTNRKMKRHIKALYISLMNNKCRVKYAIHGPGLVMGNKGPYNFYPNDIYKALNIIDKYKAIGNSFEQGIDYKKTKSAGSIN